MFWADKIAKELSLSGKPQHINDAKSPSGRVHVGALRGVIIHDLIYKSLLNHQVKAEYTFIIDDLDPMDSLPFYLPAEKYEKYIGIPLKDIQIPKEDPRFEREGQALEAKNYAEYYAQEFIGVFNKLGAKPEILWNSQLYKEGRLDKQIKQALDSAEKIQEIYEKISGSKRPKDYLPFQPICENCGKIGTTSAKTWDGKLLSYECEEQKVDWAIGCGNRGKVSPFGGTGKMPFRVEWPAKWAALGISVEGEGKDHSSKGGTRDTANAISKEVFKYEPPYDIPYEHFLLSGQKMSSSKGIGVSAAQVAEILPSNVLRFLMVSTRAMQHIDFNPEAEHTIPKLFDDFDNAREGKDSNLARIWELSLTSEKVDFFVPRFRDLINLVQMPNINLEKWAEKQKGSKLSVEDKKALAERISYVKIYLDKFAPQSVKFNVSVELPEETKNLSPIQKDLLKMIANMVEAAEDPEVFQNDIYQLGKKLGLSSSQTFEAIYRSLIGKDFGPKAAWLILSLKKEFVKKRFKEAAK